MKIIRLSTFLDFGGVETRLTNISHVQDKNEWVFVTMNREGKAAKIIRGNRKRIINLQAKPSIYSLKTFLKVYITLKKEKPDVIHTSGAEANFHGILAAKLAKVPVIIGEEIGTPNHSKKAQLIFSKVYAFADYFVGNSKTVLDVVHKLDKVPQKKLVRIDNPILFKPLQLKTENNNGLFRILTISRLEPVKNIEGVLSVLAQLVKEYNNIHLTIVGSGTSEISLKEKVKYLQLGNYVDFVGFINDPYPYLANADLYILNSFSEGFSNSLIEAMYSKTPSLSTDVGAAPEIIQYGINGFITASDNEPALYENIKTIMSLSHEERKNIGEQGHQTVVNNFSLDKHIEELMKIYKKQL